MTPIIKRFPTEIDQFKIKYKEVLTRNGSRSYATRTEMIPPDGGWGWVILAANCILMFLLPTSPVCYGVIYLALVEQQGISNTTASGITAVLLGLATFLAPVSTALSGFYSHRKLAVTGVAMMSLGLLFCSFSLNITWLYFSFVLIGIGNSLGTPQIFLIGQEYFTTKRVTANALASAAYTCGYVIIPSLLIKLIGNYSIQGAFLIWAGIMLNGMVGAMLYQPVEKHMKPKQTVTFRDDVHTIENCVNHSDDQFKEVVQTNVNLNGPNEHIYNDNRTNEFNMITVDRKERFLDAIELQDLHNEDDISLHSAKEEDEYAFKDTISLGEPNSPGPEGNSLLKYALSRKLDRPVSFVSTSSMDSFYTVKTNFKSMVSIAPSEYYDVLGSWLSIQSAESLPSPFDVVETQEINGAVPVFIENEPKTPGPIAKKKKNRSHRILGLSFPYFSDMIKIDVITSPVFLIIAVSSAIYRQIYYGYSSFLPVISYQKELQEHIPMLFLVLATSEIISKFGTGFVADRGWIKPRTLYMSSTIVNFSGLLMTALSTTFILLASATCILGIGLGISASLGPVMLVNYLSLDVLPQSYGLMLLLSGVTTFILLPIQGWTIDATGSANYLCYIFASLCLVPLVLWSFMPLAKRYQKRQQLKK